MRVKGLHLALVEELLVSDLSGSTSFLKALALPMEVERAHLALEGAECTHCDKS